MSTAALRPDGDLSDKELVRLSRGGSAAAFTALSERYMPALKSRANRYSSLVGVDIEDFVQEGMIALFRAVKGYDEQMGIQFSTYAVTCIHNSMATAIKAHMKSRNNGPSIDGVDEERMASPFGSDLESLEDMYIAQEDSALLAGQIKSLLSDFERRILRFYLKGNSYREISALLGVSQKSVDNALQRIRRKLRSEL